MIMLKGKQMADYFDIFCENCGERTDNEYLGGDPAVPHFRATCKQCNESTELKLSRWRGLPLSLKKN